MSGLMSLVTRLRSDQKEVEPTVALVTHYSGMFDSGLLVSSLQNDGFKVVVGILLQLHKLNKKACCLSGGAVEDQ